ncbi:hypothetical protein [Nocardia sp. NPDC004722]
MALLVLGTNPGPQLHVDEELFSHAAALAEVPADGNWEDGWIEALFSLIRATAEVETNPGGTMFTVTGVPQCADVTYDTDYDETGEIRGIELFVETCDAEVRLARVYYDCFDCIDKPRYLPWRRDVTTAELLLRAVIEDLNESLRAVRNSFAC